MLGVPLLGQKKFAEAEPLLLSGYDGMKKQENKIPPPAKIRLNQAVERLVQFYEATSKPDEAAKWRKELKARQHAAEESGENAIVAKRSNHGVAGASRQLSIRV